MQKTVAFLDARDWKINGFPVQFSNDRLGGAPSKVNGIYSLISDCTLDILKNNTRQRQSRVPVPCFFCGGRQSKCRSQYATGDCARMAKQANYKHFSQTKKGT